MNSSMDTFEIGEVAIFMPSQGSEREVTIIGPLQMRYWSSHGPDFTGALQGVTYLMDDQNTTEDPGRRCVYPWQLRKKKPPRDDLQLVRWSECPWQPQTVNS